MSRRCADPGERQRHRGQRDHARPEVGEKEKHHDDNQDAAVTQSADDVVDSDFDEITALLNSAFSSSLFESTLVIALRQSGRSLFEWVIREGGDVAAHVAFSRAYRGNDAIGYHLAPVAVRPHLQRQGLGTALISHALHHHSLAATPVFVLGDPRYYGRFGFERIMKPVCPFDPSNDHFQALRWRSARYLRLATSLSSGCLIRRCRHVVRSRVAA